MASKKARDFDFHHFNGVSTVRTFWVNDGKNWCECFVHRSQGREFIAYELHPVSDRPTPVLFRDGPRKARQALREYLAFRGSLFAIIHSVISGS